MSKFFSELDPKNFKDKTIILDIDGTLTQDGSNKLDERVRTMINLLKKKNRIYLFSNKYNKSRVAQFAEKLQINYLHTLRKKPNKKVFESIPQNLRHQLVVIGDKFLTDGLLAKNIAAQFIKVKRITSPHDSLWTRLTYIVDDIASIIFLHPNDT